MRILSTISGIAVSSAVLLAAPAHAERLSLTQLPGFVIGHNATNGEQSIVEQVPQGETVENWTRMVTTQRFAGLAQRTTPAALARTMVDGAAKACPGAKASPIATAPVSGRPAARFQLDCPRSRGGIPETFLFLGIAGQSNIYVKQVAFRGRFVAADLAWGRSILSAIALCADRDRQPACQ